MRQALGKSSQKTSTWYKESINWVPSWLWKWLTEVPEICWSKFGKKTGCIPKQWVQKGISMKPSLIFDQKHLDLLINSLRRCLYFRSLCQKEEDVVFYCDELARLFTFWFIWIRFYLNSWLYFVFDKETIENTNLVKPCLFKSTHSQRLQNQEY